MLGVVDHLKSSFSELSPVWRGQQHHQSSAWIWLYPDLLRRTLLRWRQHPRPQVRFVPNVAWGLTAMWCSWFAALVTEASAIAASLAAPEHANGSDGKQTGAIRRRNRAEAHRRRQRAYRERRTGARVTDQACRTITPPPSIALTHRPRCAICGCQSRWIDPFGPLPLQAPSRRRRRRVGERSKNYASW